MTGPEIDTQQPIAIVGLDCRFPQAPDPHALWQLLLAGADAVTEVPEQRWRAGELHDPAGGPGSVNHRDGGFLSDADAFDYEFFGITPREAAAMDPQQRLLLQAAWRAFEDATLDPRRQAKSRTGVFVGVMANEWAAVHMRDYARITPQIGTGNGYFMTANRISYQFDLNGPSLAIDTACSSSLVAVHQACVALAAGECDQALAAGVNIAITPALNVFYTQAGVAAADGRCKPFSGKADGMGRGEGVAVLVLRRLADAQADGLPIYAVITGSAVNNDGRSNGITAPNRWAQQQVIAETYRRAGVPAAQVAFVEAHGTGTVLGDMIEAKALGAVHAVPRPQPCALGSIKGNLGHAEGAAGVAGLIKVALSLRHRLVPPTRYAADENPRLRLARHGLRLLDEPMPLPEGVIHGAVSSFGMGGTNAHMLLSSAPATSIPPETVGGGVLTVSSNDRDGLRRNATQLAERLRDDPAALNRLCWSSNLVRSSNRYRLAVAVADRAQAVSALHAAAVGEDADCGVAQSLSTGWLFAGQGSQYRGMSRALHEHSPAYRHALAAVDARLTPHLGRSVTELLFGDSELVHRTDFAQPAIFAVEYALARVLTDLGVEPAWLLGHSVGEYAAATLAGVLELDDACRLICARGRLMHQLPGTGSMLAVRGSADEVGALIATEAAVAIGAVNGPAEVVLSGDADAVGRIGTQLTDRGITVRPLQVSHAFHSPLMQPMLEAFAEVAAECRYNDPEIPIYSTVRGRLLEPGEPMDAAYWVEHVHATVRFAEAAAAAMRAEPTHLIEVSPRRVLTPMIARAHGVDRPVPAPCPGPEATGGELDATIAALYRDGLNPNWDVLYDSAARVRQRLGGYEFSTASRFWIERDTPAPNPETPGTQSPTEGVMNELIALFREQAAVLNAVAAGKSAPTPIPAPRPDLSASRQPDSLAAQQPEVAAAVRAEAARISGFPAGKLSTGQTLSGDLGFDSIMIADLLNALGRRFPGVVVGPEWYTPATTLGDVMALVPGQEPAVEPQDRIEDFPEVKAIADRIAAAESMGMSNPYFLVNDGISQDTSLIDGEPVLTFSSYNYLGMSGHPAVVSAVQEAVARYGSSCSASRMLSGEKPIHTELERELAALLGTEDAIALVSGHATNVTVIGHLVGEGDLIIHDSLAHDSIVQGCKLSGATRRPFPHNDHAALDRILTEIRHQYRRVLIVIEGIYSQDGDIPDLPAIIAVKKAHRALLMIDEAHSIGVLGATGAGIGEHFGVDRGDVELWSGTMSKALAGCGGYVAGSGALIRYLKYTTPGFVYSVGITPSNAAASLAALRELRARPELLEQLRSRSELFLKLAKEIGIDTGDSFATPVIPCIVGDSMKTLALSSALLRRGVNVNPILYPAVPEEKARLRFFVTACHTEEQIRRTVRVLAEEMAALR